MLLTHYLIKDANNSHHDGGCKK